MIFMQVLPLKFIHDDDKKAVGLNLFNLAKLRHLGLPVVESVVVIPPTKSIQNLIEKYSRLSELKNHLGNLKLEILRLKAPESLSDVHASFSGSAKGFNLNVDKLWQGLLEKWSQELISKIERGEGSFSFTPQQVVLTSNFEAIGTAFFDETREHVVIKIDKGELNFKLSENIEKLVNEGNRKLVIPQVFSWVIEEGTIKIIKLTPFTQDISNNEPQNPHGTQIPVKKTHAKTATKILLDYSGQVLTDLSWDAVFLRLDNPLAEKAGEKIEKILKFGDSPVIFFPDFPNSIEKNLEFAKSFIFFKNKKRLDLQIVLPRTFSVEEFLNLKRQYASLGIYSKGSLKIWKQFSTVSDFINIEIYLDAGFDGAIIELDKIVEMIVGVNSGLFLSEPRLDWTQSVEKFFKEMGFNNLVKNHKQVLITGKTIGNEELLNYFIKSGVWGIAVRENVIDSLREHVNFLEKNITKKSSG